MWNDVKHQEIPEDTTVLSLLLRSRFYIQGIVGIRSLYDTMQVPFHCRTFPDCEPRNHVPRNYIPGIRWNSSKCKGCDGNLYWFTMCIITCYFSEVAKIIVVTSLPWNALRSDPNNPHMGTQPSLETLITPCHSCRSHQGNGSHHTKGSDLTKTSSSIGKWWSFLIGGVLKMNDPLV